MKPLLAALALVLTMSGAAAQKGVASWYAGQFIGRQTASGEVYTGRGLTAAHRHAPLNSCLKIQYKRKTVLVRVNDRGPYVDNRIIDVTPTVAKRLGFYKEGLARVNLHKARCPR